MPYNNPIVAGIQLVIPAIQSPNFVTGVSGWTINRDGSFELNNGTVRGTLIIGNPPSSPGATISGTITAALTTAYAPLLTSLTQFSILLYPGDGSYHYEIIGINTGPADVWASGWVSTAGVVREHYRHVDAFGLIINTWGALMGASDRAQWQFGVGYGGAKVGANIMNVYDTQWIFGLNDADIGSVTFLTDATFDKSLIAAGATNASLPIGTTVGGIRVGAGIVDAVQVTTIGALTAAASAETNIPNLAMSAPMDSNRSYDLLAQICLTCTVATDTYVIRVRVGTALSGTIVAESDGTCGATITAVLVAEYLPSASGNVNFFVSFLRRAGTGTIQATGDNAAGSSRTLALIRDSGSQLSWRTS